MLLVTICKIYSLIIFGASHKFNKCPHGGAGRSVTHTHVSEVNRYVCFAQIIVELLNLQKLKALAQAQSTSQNRNIGPKRFTE